MLNNYIDVLKNNYANFKGRATRTQYWSYVLVSFVVALVCHILDRVISGGNEQFGLFGTLYSLAVLVPSLAIGCRRLHDTGRSGWWLFLYLIPLIGAIVLIIFFIISSDQDNEYGPAPSLY
ncbi:DUF805 domain-containing protein [Vibrio hangzhouensis]|uniref:Uncharacterized membrane protein YhaH, DUF805 family n=1 Tax=Vibrio hangzhouensis TaxID=462991 RepID=A0A1H5W792_9VIBR|nr:DUF805 domain-containing protein [Vibrio hangzhouensis]SEF94697.1 Uncharacterized membrane protein YhaH, DUF805 family [Vibrio hangzhouensis]